MQLSRFLAALSLPAALVLAGCGGGSNSRTVSTVTTAAPALLAYVADAGDSTVKVFGLPTGASAVNTATVTTVSTTSTLNGVPVALALDPAGRYLFVTLHGGGDLLQVFRINTDGSLPSAPTTSIALTGSAAGNNSEIAVAAPAGSPGGTEYVYVATGVTGQLNAFRFNSTAQTLTAFTPNVSGTDTPFSLTTASGGAYLYSGGAIGNPRVRSYGVNTADGTLTVINVAASGTLAPVLVANDPTGPYFYTFDEGNEYLYAYQRNADGSLTAGNLPPTNASGNDLVVAPNGSAVYLSNGTMGTITQATIGANGDLNTPTQTAAISGSNFVGIVVDSASTNVFTVDTVHKNVVDFPLSGTQLGSPQSMPLGVSNPVAAVFVSTQIVNLV